MLKLYKDYLLNPGQDFQQTLKVESLVRLANEIKKLEMEQKLILRTKEGLKANPNWEKKNKI